MSRCTYFRVARAEVPQNSCNSRGRTLRSMPPTVLLMSLLMMLLAQLLVVPKVSAEPDDASPQILWPAPTVTEVAGGSVGPVEVDFSNANHGWYITRVSCDQGYEQRFPVLWDGTEPRAALPIRALPAWSSCGILITAADSEQVVSRKSFMTASRTPQINAVATPGGRTFYPHRVDGYLDAFRITYRLSQPSSVTIDITPRAGGTRAESAINEAVRESGPHAYAWDGRVNTGQRATPGAYNLKVTATNERGDVVRATQSLTLAAGPIAALGSSNYAGSYGKGWGRQQPTIIDNGGSLSGVAYDLRWSKWDSARATAVGKTYRFKPGGGYYERGMTIRLRASRLGPCGPDRRPAYTRLEWRSATEPGRSVGPRWRPWTRKSGNICTPL